MNIEKVNPTDIDALTEMQPPGWTDIRPYFYYYCGSDHCEPLKISIQGKTVAVGTTIRHQDSGWLAHIIVHPDYRNNGLGNMMAQALVKSLDRSRFKTIYLDATEMGYPVYKKLGFEVEADYIHMDGDQVDLRLENSASVVPYQEHHRNEVLALDKAVSAECRLDVLSDHLNASILYISEGEVKGCYFPSLFDRFILASEATAGTELMKLRMRLANTARFPSANQKAIDFLLANNYTIVRTSKRMILGEKRNWNTAGIFNRISGGMG